jgi:CRP-like cAMP-binding protein
MNEKDFPLIFRKTGWLGNQPESFQSQVIKSGFVKKFEEGDVVYNIGDAPGGIFCVFSGSLGVDLASPIVGPFLAGRVSVGLWIGEGPYLMRTPRVVSLISREKSSVFCLPLDAMDRIEKLDHTAGRRFGQIAFIHLNSALDVISVLLLPEARERLAATLLRLRELTHSDVIHISQQELGNMSNASRNSVNAALGTFARNGWIKKGPRRIEIVNQEALLKFLQDT